MYIRKSYIVLVSLLLFSSLLSRAQDSTLQLPEKYLGAVTKKADDLTDKLDQKTQKYLDRFQKAEARLLRKLAKKDSTKAAQLLAQSKGKYQQLQQVLKGEKSLQEYIPSLDTLTTSLKFLSQNKEWLSKAKDAQKDLSQALDKVEGLQSSLGKAEAVNRFLRERQDQLATQLKDLPFLKDFKRLQKQAYYYKAQVEEYKALLKDKSKWEKKALELLSKTKPFQSFIPSA